MSASAGSHGRNLGLDIARATAILGVLSSHVLLELVAGAPRLRTWLVYSAGASVELFFALSGFLIGGLLIDLAERGTRPKAVVEFWFRRWMRTLPLYYAVLWIAGQLFGQSDPHAWLFLQNFYFREIRLIPASWSLVLEEFFYLFFPALMLALAGVVSGGRRLVAIVALGLVVACTASRLGNAYGVFHFGWDLVHYQPFMRMDCAAYGVLASCLYRRAPVAVSGFVRRWWWLLLPGCLALVVAWGGLFVWMLQQKLERLAELGFRVWGPPRFVIESSLLELVFAVVVLTLFVVVRRGAFGGPAAWAIRQCSVLSYALYLVHMPAMTWIDTRLHLAPGPGKAAVQLLATLAAAIVAHLAIERPFLALRDQLSRRMAPAAAPGAL